MTTGEKLSSFVTRHPHVAKFTAKLSMHHGLRGVRRTPPQPKLPPRPRMQLLLAVALSLVTTTTIFTEEKPATKPAAPPQSRVPEGVELKANLPYAGNDNPWQMVDLYLPKNRTPDKPLPVVVYLHGGGWSGGSRAGGGMAAGYAASGNYAGVSVGYRLSAEVKWPARIHDCKAAIRWIRGHAKEYNLDPDRIGVTGTSAGGHLVSLLGLTESVKDLRRQHRRIHQPHLEGDVRGELLRPDRHGRTADARRRGTEGRSRSGRAPRALGAREGLQSEDCGRSPEFSKLEINGDKTVVTFGLFGSSALRPFDVLDAVGFAVCGEDKAWHWAKGKVIANNKVELTCDKVSAPIAVRYALADNPVANLFSNEGLPVTTFRTDDFEMTTKPKSPVAPAPAVKK